MVDIFRRLTQKDEGETERADKKMISVLVPVYNEYDNVVPLSKEITDQLGSMPQYDYELVFIDNNSGDGTRDLLHMLCSRSKNIKAILNANNFGPDNSAYYGICQCSGDCVICMSGDHQDPPDMIPQFVKAWEDGSAVVCGVDASEPRGFAKLFRSAMKRFSDVGPAADMTGFALYDRSVVDILRTLDDPAPYLSGVITELGFERTDIAYERQPRRSGEDRGGSRRRFDEAMRGLTSYTKAGARAAMFIGAAGAALTLLAAVVGAVIYVVRPGCFAAVPVLTLLAVCLFGSLQLFFTGVLGEYVLSVNTRVMRRPPVIEQTRLNFDGDGGGRKAKK